jgi:hypothetical protein
MSLQEASDNGKVSPRRICPEMVCTVGAVCITKILKKVQELKLKYLLLKTCSRPLGFSLYTHLHREYLGEKEFRKL